MKKYIRSTVAALLSASLLFTLPSCSGKNKYLDSSREEQKTVITIGEMDVPLEMYRYVALNYKYDYEYGKSSDIWLGEDGAEKLESLNAATDDTLRAMYAVPLLAMKYGIDPNSSYIKASVETQMKDLYKSYENDYKAYGEELDKSFMTDEVYRFILRNDILSGEILYEMVENGDIVTDDEKLEDVIAGDEFVRVKQILISNERGRTDEEDLALAEKLLQKVNAGEDFDSLVQQHGEDLYMFNNSDGYYICRGTYDEAFEDAAFSLEIGEVSGIVKTAQGYSIVKKYPKDAKYLSANFDELCDLYRDSAYNVILSDFTKTLTVTRLEKCAEYTIFNLSDVK